MFHTPYSACLVLFGLICASLLPLRLCADDADAPALAPDLPALQAAAAVLRASSCLDPTAERLAAMDVLQQSVDQSKWNADFAAHRDGFGALSLADQQVALAKQPVYWFYEDAMDKLLREIPAEQVAPDSIALWHLYNMGYVLKTPRSCIGIDLSHRRAEELAPLLDALLITHSHGDHVHQPLTRAMLKAGKPVLSNFVRESPYFMPEPQSWQLGDLLIRTSLSDHNRRLRNFVVVYEIQCGSDDDAPLLCHSGDASNIGQLTCSRWPDIHIIHPKVGIVTTDAAQKLQTRLTLISHLAEMGHNHNKWRWSYTLGLTIADQCAALGRRAAVPVWGEKIIFNKDLRAALD